MFNVGQRVCGFRIKSVEDLPEIDGKAVLARHACGAKLLMLLNDDDNKSFSISFKTTPKDDTGVFHILEHSVLCGSKKFPVKEPFVNLLKTSMQTFLNALTYPDKTMYPVASTNEQDLLNLTDVYLDAVFHPALHTDKRIFEQEGWHYELAEDGTLTYNGVVFNEMKGALSDPEDVLYHAVNKALYPGTCYAHESGGNPRSIPQLSYEQFVATHKQYYHPTNSYIVLYGNLNPWRFMAFLNDEYLWEYMPIEAGHSTGYPLPALRTSRVEMATSPENACVGLGFSVGKANDFERVLAADVLMDALMGGNESPIKRAVLDAHIGGDCSAFLMDAQEMPAAFFVLRNAEAGVADKFRQIVVREAERLVCEGIPRDVLQASLAQLSFDLRERDRGIADGVALAMSALSGWLYDESNPTAYLRYEEPLAHMRAGLDGRYFEDVLQSLLVENDRTTVVEVVPVAQEGESAEEAELAAHAAILTEADREAIAADVSALRARQEAPDAPQDVAKLPQLRVSDIGPAKPDPATVEGTLAGRPLLYHPVPTRNIAYVYRYFDLGCVPFEDLPAVTVLALLLGNLDTTQRTAAQLDSFQRTHLGALRFFTDTHVRCDDANAVTAKMVISASALSEELENLAAIPEEVCRRTRFADVDRIHDALVQRRVALEQSFMNEGHSRAMNRAAAHLFKSGVILDQLNGVSFYQWLCGVLEDYDAQAPVLCKKLEQLQAAIFRPENEIISFTGSEADLAGFDAALAACAGVQKGASVQENALAIPDPVRANEAFIVPTDVTYTACGANVGLLPQGVGAGTWTVASSALSLDYLWNEVRVKGGAYGCGFRRTPMGYARFYSYRDPRIAETLQRFAGAGQWLASFDPTPEEMEGYVVSTVASHDAPAKPRAIARRQDASWFAGWPQDHREAVREEELSATPDALRALAPAVTAAATNATICTFGNRETIEQNRAQFDTVVDLFGAVL